MLLYDMDVVGTLNQSEGGVRRGAEGCTRRGAWRFFKEMVGKKIRILC